MQGVTKNGKKKKVKIQFQIDPEIRKELRICAAMHGLPEAKMLEKIIKTYIEEHPYFKANFKN